MGHETLQQAGHSGLSAHESDAEIRADAFPCADEPAQPVSPGDEEVIVSSSADRLHLRLIVPEHAQVQVHLDVRTAGGLAVGQQQIEVDSRRQMVRPVRGWTGQRLAAWLRDQEAVLPAWLMSASLVLYVLVRLVNLPAFPIYFFTDEAIQTVSAADLLRDHLISPDGELLPTYFENGSQYNLGVSVYVQAIPYILFGKSIWVTRGVAVLLTLIAAVSVGMIGERIFHSAYAWLAVMLLSVTPAWFLHARTAFETTLAASFYAAFLLFYLLYRTQNSRYLYGAVVAGALTFYSYSAARMMMLIIALLLFVVDFRYHLRNRAALLKGLGLGVVLALPLVRFVVVHPDAAGWQMRLLGSYWVGDLSLGEKLKTFGIEYLRGFDPLYWYFPNSRDLGRHVMLGYGHVLRQTLPFALLGIGVAVWRVQRPAYRTLLLALVAAPSGAALVALGITRALAMVIPLALLSALGLAEAMEWLHRRFKVRRALLSGAVFLLLAGVNIFMLRDALVNGPLWYRDYSLTGMQYGARQVFGAIKTYLQEHPQMNMVVSPSWTNGTDVVARFFFDDPLPFELRSPEDYYKEVLPVDHTIFVMTPEEFADIPASRFAKVQIDQTIFYPDGRPGFYFVQLTYRPNAQAIIDREEAQQHEPQNDTLVLDGQQVNVHHTRLDIGQISDVFNGDEGGLIRTAGINPMQLAFEFKTPRRMQAVTLRIGGAATTVTVRVWPNGAPDARIVQQSFSETTEPRDVTLDLEGAVDGSRVELEIQNTNDSPDGHVHLWRIRFQ